MAGRFFYAHGNNQEIQTAHGQKKTAAGFHAGPP